MNHLKRGLTTALATSVAAVGLTAVSAVTPAQAATPSGVLTWEVSQYFDEHLSTHVLTGGASEDDEGVITFPGGEGVYNATTGATSVAYDGSVAGSFAFAGTTYYTVTIAEPVVSIDADGNGEITAVVSADNAAAMGNPAESTFPTRVVVTTFDAVSATWTHGASLDTLSATPDWAGVLPADSTQAASLGIAAGKPVDGQSFNPAHLAQLTKGVRALFHASGSAADAKKAPARFTAQVAPLSVDVTTTGASAKDGLTLAVTGANFRGVTNPGDDGIYVGLAQSGAMPDVSSMDNMELFAAVAYVPASAMAEGTFATELNAPTTQLDATKDYSVYTWQAHTHSNTTQDTQTPVAIDWSALTSPAKVKSAIAAKLLKKPSTTAPGKLSIKVNGAGGVKPTGRVTVTLIKGGKGGKGAKVAKKVTSKLRAGAATVKLPRLAAGRWKVKTTYAGSARYLSSVKTLSVKVAQR